MLDLGAKVGAITFFAGSVVAAADPIVIEGSKFFYKTNGTQFFIKGVAYQPDWGGVEGATSTYFDPLADATGCTRDIPYIVKLGMNVVHVYALDPTKNHDACMSAFADAGIYVFADLSAPVTGAYIDGTKPVWNSQIYSRYTSVIDAMQGYANTIGFFAGNEVFSQLNETRAASFVKAAVRDMKQYIVNKGYRALGVGYAMEDDAEILQNTIAFLNCGDQTDAIDFLGLNWFSWCGDSTYTESGYSVITQTLTNYSVPTFFSEYGCNAVEPRPFTEVQALYGPEMNDVFSGGIAYAYFQEDNDYGLVNIVNDASVEPNQDYDNLSSQLAKVSPTGVQSSAYSPTNSPAQCPVTGISWAATASPLPPTLDQRNSSITQAVGTSTTASSGEGTAVSIGTVTPTPTGTHDLTTGAQVGVGVGVGVGGLLLLVTGIYFWRRRGRNKSASAEWPDPVSEKDGTEVDRGAMLGNDGERHEMEQPLPEMPTGREAQELSARQREVELSRNASKNAPPGIESRHELPANEEGPRENFAHSTSTDL